MKPFSPPLIYHDGTSLFLEHGSTVLRFTFSEAGLHRALKHIPNITQASNYVPHGGNIADRALSASGKIAKITSTTARKRDVAKASEALRSAALDIVRRKA